MTALLLVLGFVGFVTVNWGKWTSLAATQTTDDAQIRAQTSRLASRITGTVRTVAVQDFQRVQTGDLLIEIDPTDYKIAADQAQAGVAAAEAALANLGNQLALQRITIKQAEAQRDAAAGKELQTRQENDRQQSLVQTGSTSRQIVEQAISAHVTAESNLRAAETAIEAQQLQLTILGVMQQQRRADLAAARSALEAAQVRLGYTRVVAPFDGTVGERQIQVGNYVGIGTSLISLVPQSTVHVIANYKETQLPRVVPGQPVEIAVDALPGVAFKGHVERVSPASGSQFALLPPDNASGNFTKVVQRIPVRISLDENQPSLDRLRAGMSVVTRIRADGDRGSGALQ
ncbi:HlyD family secretion protein [Rhizobium sp. BR 314]|uniref:HlyD family secretion protein n=1 Tax=Rhizobium sp. BR 314 TaxID=3040013 RepID=UPI0039BF1BA5